MNPSSGVVAGRAFPVPVPVSFPVPCVRLGVTRFDPLGAFPSGVLEAWVVALALAWGVPLVVLLSCAAVAAAAVAAVVVVGTMVLVASGRRCRCRCVIAFGLVIPILVGLTSLVAVALSAGPWSGCFWFGKPNWSFELVFRIGASNWGLLSVGVGVCLALVGNGVALSVGLDIGFRVGFGYDAMRLGCLFCFFERHSRSYG